MGCTASARATFSPHFAVGTRVTSRLRAQIHTCGFPALRGSVPRRNDGEEPERNPISQEQWQATSWLGFVATALYARTLACPKGSGCSPDIVAWLTPKVRSSGGKCSPGNLGAAGHRGTHRRYSGGEHQSASPVSAKILKFAAAPPRRQALSSRVLQKMHRQLPGCALYIRTQRHHFTAVWESPFALAAVQRRWARGLFVRTRRSLERREGKPMLQSLH
jgi:hypothetical protein